MSILARTGLQASRSLASASRQSVRFAHGVEVNRVKHTLPTDVKNKPWLAVKMIIYAGLGFGTPFYAVHYHLNKQ